MALRRYYFIRRYLNRRSLKIWLPIVTLIYLFSIRSNLRESQESFDSDESFSFEQNYRNLSSAINHFPNNGPRSGNENESNNVCATNRLTIHFNKWMNIAENHKHPDCSATRAVIIENDGTVKYDERIIKCLYTVSKWSGDDFAPTEEKVYKEIKNGQQLDINEEFFHMNCQTKDNEIIKGEYIKF